MGRRCLEVAFAPIPAIRWTAIELPEMTKHELAGRILDEVIALRRPASVVAETGLVSSNSKLQD